MKLAVFDHNTLIKEGRICEETLLVLSTLKDQKVRLCVADFDVKVNKKLEVCGILESFDLVIGHPGFDKNWHIEKIQENFPGIKPEEICLFDDAMRSTGSARKFGFGVNSVLVDEKVGVTLEDIKGGNVWCENGELLEFLRNFIPGWKRRHPKSVIDMIIDDLEHKLSLQMIES